MWTIGYGHTGSDVHAGLTTTPEQANEILLADVASAVSSVNRLATVQLTQDEFDALVDFVFNVGSGHLAGPTLLRDLNESDFVGAAAQFESWDHVRGAIEQGRFGLAAA